ncbi:TPA: hypothetical protein SAN82_005361, partial [Pseudomonas putida]|nr:hypothetical protein [Pseudomonas putida]
MSQVKLTPSEKLKSQLQISDRRLSAQLADLLKEDCTDVSSTVKKFIALLDAVNSHEINLDSFGDLVSLHELVAPHDGAVVSMMSIHFNLAIGTISNLAPLTPYVENFYQQLTSGRAIGVYLATELAHGNNLVALETQATYLPEKGVFLLNSETERAWKFMPNSCPCDRPKIAVVLANLSVAGRRYGIFPFLLPLSSNGVMTKGVTITPLGKKPGFYLDNAITSFNQVELPYEALLAGDMLALSREGEVKVRMPKFRDRFALVTSKIHSGKLCMAVSSVAAAKSALHITYRYAQQRKVHGYTGVMPVINYQHVKEGLAWDTLNTVAHSLYLRELTQKVSKAFEGGRKNFIFSDVLLAELIVAKSLCTWRTQEVLVACRERCGAQGLFSENKIVSYIVSNFGAITAEGDNLVLSLKAGGLLLQNKPSPLTKLPVLQDLVEVLQAWSDFLSDKLTALSKKGGPSIQLDIGNKHTDDVIALSQAWAVMNVASCLLEQHEDADIRLVAEGYLLDCVFRVLRSLVSQNLISIADSQAIENRRLNFIRQHADRINLFIDAFGVEQADIHTPISS